MRRGADKEVFATQTRLAHEFASELFLMRFLQTSQVGEKVV